MVLQAKQLTKTHGSQSGEGLTVLKDLELSVDAGTSTAILGQSGSGKSTLLSLLTGLDDPTSGEIWIQDKPLSQLSEKQRNQFRAQSVGIVFQQFHLMPHLTALENVMLPLEIQGGVDAKKAAQEVLNQVGLSERHHHFPAQLSGGECQRVAIARSVIHQPALVFADEPTGSLDVETGEMIMEVLFRQVEQSQTTLILVTHNRELAQRCDQQFLLQGGRLESVDSTRLSGN